jgi:hypothetical protein
MFPGECWFLPNDNAYVPINQFMAMLQPFFKLIHALLHTIHSCVMFPHGASTKLIKSQPFIQNN